MRSAIRNDVLRRIGFAGAAGGLVSVLMLAGCPGTLDLSQFQSGSGGNTGTGGGNATGGATGTGGATADCTGGNDGATLVTAQCASPLGCHNPTDANTSAAGLDLTVNSTIASRLVDVMSLGNSNAGSLCGGNTEPYLEGGSIPAKGLLIQKIQSSPKCSPSENPPCCGNGMPYPGAVLLSVPQQNCLIQWATTLTSPQ